MINKISNMIETALMLRLIKNNIREDRGIQWITKLLDYDYVRVINRDRSEIAHIESTDPFANSAVLAVLCSILYPRSKIGVFSESYKKSEEVIRLASSILTKPNLSRIKIAENISYTQDTINIDDAKIMAAYGELDRIRGHRFDIIIINGRINEEIYQEIIVPMLSCVYNPVFREDVMSAENILIDAGFIKEQDRRQWESNKLFVVSGIGE